MSKKYQFRGSFEKQHGKSFQALVKSESQHLYHIHWPLPRKLSWRKSLLFTCEISVLLVNTLVADEKNPVLNRNNSTIPIHIQLSETKKTFSQFFAAFLKYRLNFKHFEKKDDPHSFCISEYTDSGNVIRWISRRSRFRGPFDKQHSTLAEALLNSALQNLSHIHWSLPSQLSWKKFLLLT